MNLNNRHLPKWLEKNWLFRKAFLLRKLFLIKKSFSHYSQWGEDISIVRHFSKGYRGFFVDVGCFHPVKYNNTYQLYKKGWRGVNIDLDSIKIEGFNIVRPQDTNIACAVSTTEGTTKYWSNGFYSLISTLDKDFANGMGGMVEKSVQTKTLTSILDQTKYRGRRIDFLSVDAEGHDQEVLSSLDFDRYRPRMIAVEIFAKTLEEVEKSALYQYLKTLNYSLINWVGITLIFEDQSNRDKGI